MKHSRLILTLILVATIFIVSPLYASNGKKLGHNKAPKNAIKSASKWNKIVVLETTQGNIELQLYPDVAPQACENFVRLVRKGYYNGIIFHRVIKGFMIQGGDPTGTGRGGNSIWGREFVNEVSPQYTFNSVGILAMANAGPDTNGSQFFITTNVEHTRHLNGGYTIFGHVISGMDAVTRIENCRTNPANDKPLVNQVIKKAYIKGEKK